MRQEIKVTLTMDFDADLSKKQIKEFIKTLDKICPYIIREKYKSPTIEHIDVKEECETYNTEPNPKDEAKNKEIKLMIIENYIDWFTSNEDERDKMKKGSRVYVNEDWVDEIGQSFEL